MVRMRGMRWFRASAARLREELELPVLVLLRYGHGVPARETGRAMAIAARVVDGSQEALLGEVGQAVGADLPADLLHRVRGRDELGFPRRIDAVVAGAGSGRA